MEYSQVIVIIICLVLSAFFSGVEIAFVSSNKLQIELQKKQGYISGKILGKFLQRPSRFLGATLIGNNLALVVYGIFMANLLEPFLAQALPGILANEFSVLILQTIVATLIVLITAEFIPKSLFMLNPNRLLAFFALPMLVIYYVLYPVVLVVVGMSKFMITKVFGWNYSENKPVFGLTDLNNFIKSNTQSETIDQKVEVNTRIFHNALEFKTIRVRECMVPRTEIVAVDIEDGIEKLKKAFIESGHSKIMVYKDSIDDIIGYCHSLELFKKPKDIQELLTPIIIVPETMLANELMIQFITERKSLALVVDEFGGTSGVVSIEDIIEQIFGEIQDEHDFEEWVEQQVDANTYIFSARHEIDYLNDKYNWNLPKGDYDTLGGLILSIKGDLPVINDVIEVPPFYITIMAMEDTRIDNVKITIKHEEI
jgi:putative hemolysin